LCLQAAISLAAAFQAGEDGERESVPMLVFSGAGSGEPVADAVSARVLGLGGEVAVKVPEKPGHVGQGRAGMRLKARGPEGCIRTA
jgi:hypothetical protein